MAGSRIGVWVLATALALAACDSATPSAEPAASGPTVAGPSATVSSGAAPTATPTPSTTPSSAAPTPTVTKPSTPTAADMIALVRTGGIAGQVLTVTVLPDGTWKRGDGRTVSKSGKLTAAQTAKLHTMAADPRLAAEAKRIPPTRNSCSDAYSYLLSVGKSTVRYVDCPSQGSPPAVTMQIVALLQEAAGR